MTKLKPCKICGGNHMYLCKHYVCDGIEFNILFCNDCKTSFYNENYEEDEDSTRDWWNTRAEKTCKIERIEHDEYGSYYYTSCGHCTVSHSHVPCFCSECGAKVVGD